MNDLLNNYANNISDKFTIIAKDNDFKQSKFQRFIDETKSLIINVTRDGMTKKEFDKINEVYSIVLHDLQKWEIDKEEIQKEVKMFKFYRSDNKAMLGKLEQKNINLNEDSSFFKKLFKKRPKSYNIRNSQEESTKIKSKLSSRTGAILSTRDAITNKVDDTNPIYNNQNHNTKFKFQSAFLPSPKRRDMNDESSMCIRLNNGDENLDISSGTDNYQKIFYLFFSNKINLL